MTRVGLPRLVIVLIAVTLTGAPVAVGGLHCVSEPTCGMANASPPGCHDVQRLTAADCCLVTTPDSRPARAEGVSASATSPAPWAVSRGVRLSLSPVSASSPIDAVTPGLRVTFRALYQLHAALLI